MEIETLVSRTACFLLYDPAPRLARTGLDQDWTLDLKTVILSAGLFPHEKRRSGPITSLDFYTGAYVG